jgi:hypothetical protein
MSSPSKGFAAMSTLASIRPDRSLLGQQRLPPGVELVGADEHVRQQAGDDRQARHDSCTRRPARPAAGAITARLRDARETARALPYRQLL